MTNELRKAAKDLLEGVEAAIEAGVWKVDGACDPDAVIVRLRQALAESANSTTNLVEPVAWVEMDKDYLAVSADPFENAIPVYTTPPKREWVGLTESEIVELAGGSITRDERMIARAIEAKLKDKNA